MTNLNTSLESSCFLANGALAGITTVGTSGESFVYWVSGGQIRIQKYDAAGRPLLDTPVAYSGGTWVRAAVTSLTGDLVAVSSDGSKINVQRLHPDLSSAGPLIQLDGRTGSGNDNWPEVAALGTDGAFVVVWYGQDNDSNENDYSIYVQKFHADGSTLGNAKVKLEAIGNSTGFDSVPSVLSLGRSGEFVVAWEGDDASGQNGVFVQKFNADGTTTGHLPMQLYAGGGDHFTKMAALGASGAFVLTWSNGADIFVQKINEDGSRATASPIQINRTAYEEYPVIQALSSGEFAVAWYSTLGNASVYVQHFNADGTTTGHETVALRATGVSNRSNEKPSIAALPNGEYVVAWSGIDGTGDYSVYVQKFNANGSTTGYAPVKLEVINQGLYNEVSPQVVATGVGGEFQVVYRMTDPWGSSPSVYSQHFNADGTVKVPAYYREGDVVYASSDVAGTVYLVKQSEVQAGWAPQNVADSRINAATVSTAGVYVPISVSGLEGGTYKLVAADPAGNLSAVSTQTLTVLQGQQALAGR